MRLVLSRFRTVRGAVVGRLFQEVSDRQGGLIDHERICDTVEREGGQLAPGEYRVVIDKCGFLHRKMPFLQSAVGGGMFQPGNGPFTLRRGCILVGDACPPGFVIHSQSTFLQLYDRIKKVISRGGDVVVEVKEEMA